MSESEHPPTRAGMEPNEVPDEALEAMRQQRFQQRVQRVLSVMRQERIDWRGVAFLTPDGRIGVRILPVDLPAGRMEGLPDGRQAGMAQP